MTAFAIAPHRCHRGDAIRFMSGRRHHHRRHRGFGPDYAFGRRAGRGDIRAAILVLLAEQPMHGYQIIQELAERTGGVWQPSPGSVYPTLQQLADEDLVREASSESGKRVYELTDAGLPTARVANILTLCAVDLTALELRQDIEDRAIEGKVIQDPADLDATTERPDSTHDDGRPAE